jgi:hypothetical protein
MALTSFKGTAYEKWLTPKQAISLLDPNDSGGSRWRSALLERLRGGRVESVAEGVQFSGPRAPAAPRNQLGPTTVANKIWESVEWNDIVFFSGDLTHEENFGAYDTLRTRFFNVRFKPDDIDAMVPKPIAPTPADSAPAAEEPETDKPPVSPTNLRAWFEVYKKVYGEATPEPHAVESAKGMFHDKQVSRSAVRSLRGPQKPGPKGPRDSDG